MTAIWFTADTHFGHANILRYCNRPYPDLATHDQALIDNWNACVGVNDTVYMLGDLCLGQPRLWPQLVAQLNGRIRLYAGNHDRAKTYADSRLFPSIVSVFTEPRVEIFCGRRYLLSHYPPGYTKNPGSGDWDAALCGHVHDKWQYRYCIRGERAVPVLNVGVDVSNLHPLSMFDVRRQCFGA